MKNGLGLVGLSLVACAHHTLDMEGVEVGPASSPDAAVTDAGAAKTSDAAEAASPDPCAPGGSGSLLQCSSGCSTSMFSDVAVIDDASNPSSFQNDWSGAYVAPTVTPSGFQFGPHMGTDWWNQYSPAGTKRTDLGDVVLCVRFSFTVVSADASAMADSFQVSLRGGSDGMVLTVGGASQGVTLSTKINASDVWQTHATSSLAMMPGPRTIEVVLGGRGNDFYAEAKNVDTSAVTRLKATYNLPAQAQAGMLGWQLPSALVVSRVVIGTPTAETWSRLAR